MTLSALGSEDKERMDPESDQQTLIFAEHLGRYRLAAGLVQGKSVVDVACGFGYGSDMLVKAGATHVLGIDNSQVAVETSSQRNSPPARFVRADAHVLPVGDASFDCVVSFETIEHLENPEQFLSEVKRVLTPGGLLIISNPNRTVYPPGNPFHVREFAYGEFGELVGRHFSNVRLLVQDNWIASVILPGELSAAASFHQPTVSELVNCTGRDPALGLYIVGVCSDSSLPEVPVGTALSRVAETASWLDEMQTRDRELASVRQALEIGHRENEAEKASIRQVLELRQNRIVTLDQELRHSYTIQDQLRARAQEAESRLASRAAQWELERNQLAGEMDRLRAERTQLEATLASIRGSAGWRLLGAYRALVRRLPGVEVAYPRVRRFISGRATGATEPPAAIRPEPETPVESLPRLILPAFDMPAASIIIPVHNNLDLTTQCLSSILSHTQEVAYEVILVDDGSTDGTAEFVASVKNLRVVSHPSSLGYLRSTNAGAALARSPYLVFLNNDTEVRPGWLPALLETVSSDPEVGLVGPKLLFPDLRLQEAGAIVWSDGTGWNYGRDDDPGRCEYNYLREVDYCSGACLLVRRDFFEEYGGLDERFAPAYYEDTDLAFAARARGLKVVYQPRAEVVHHEGASSGTDTSSGVKRFQEVNREKFVTKWREALEAQMPPVSNLLRARDRSTEERILVIDSAVPTYDQDSGSLRMDTLIHSLRALGYAVTFLPDNRDPRQPYTARLQAAGIEVLYGAYDLAERIQAMGPALRMCLASRPLVAWRYLTTVREYAPDCAFVFDTVDLHHLRESRRGAYEGKEWLDKLSAGYKELELGLVRVSDASITVTQLEKEMLVAEVPGARIHVIPNVHSIRGIPNPFEIRKDLVFMGGFNHPPNEAAVQYLVKEILPLVQAELADVRLYVVGSNPPESIRQLESEHTRITGYVPDLRPYLQGCRLSVVPLTFGAGLKGKLTQSLSEGLPVVSTSLGVEGADLVHGKHVLVADDPAAFAREVVRVYRDPDEWSILANNGLEYAEEHYSVNAVRGLLQELLAEVGADRRQAPS